MHARLTTDLPAALEQLQRAIAFDVDGDVAGDVREHLQGAAVFDLVDGDRRVGAFALRVENGSNGRRVRCVAAAGDHGRDLLPEIVAFTEREARDRIGARAIQCETRRRGLVRKLERQGFRVAGYILTKDVQ